MMSILIPCYNEEKVIYNTYNEITKEIKNFTKDYEIIFANDGSTDNTLRELKKIRDKNVKIISYSENKGLGHASKQLYKRASGSLLIQMDADLAMKPKDFLPIFLKEINSYDCMVASRYKGIKAEYPLIKIILSRAYYLSNKILFGLDIKDTQSGFFIIKKEVIDSLNLKSNGFEIHLEMFVKLKKNNFKIKEIPVKFIHRTRKSNSLKLAIKMFFNTLKIYHEN